MYESVSQQSIELRGHGCFTMEQYKELVDILLKMLEEHFQRAEERQQKRNDEDYDEQVRFSYYFLPLTMSFPFKLYSKAAPFSFQTAKDRFFFMIVSPETV